MPQTVNSSRLTPACSSSLSDLGVDDRQGRVHGGKQSVDCQPSTVNRQLSGFTLIELLVAISIIGVLVGASAIALENVRDKGRDSQRKQDLAKIKSALALYEQDQGYYPCDNNPPEGCTDTTFISSEAQPWIPALVDDYIVQLPLDPSSQGEGGDEEETYRYQVTADRLSYTLWAFLENSADSEIRSKDSALCKEIRPSEDYNYCLKANF